MAGAYTTLSVKDALGTTRPMYVWDQSGTGVGPFQFVHLSTQAGPTSTARLPSSAASTNAANVKASAATLYQASGKNNAAYDVFLVFVYDWPEGLTFATGLGYAFTKLVADADTTAIAAADVIAFNLDYA
jgi:hypothetical protein